MAGSGKRNRRLRQALATVAGAAVLAAGIAQAAARPIPPRLMARYQAALPRLDPGVRAWAEREARLELARPTFNLGELKAAIHRRFDGRQGGGPRAPLGDDAASEMALIVILMMVQDGDQNLNQTMQEAQARMAAKQAQRGQIERYDSKREKLLQLLSDIEKTLFDTQMAIVDNMKS